MNGKTDGKQAPQWRKSAIDTCLSVKILCTNSAIFDGLARKTSANCVKYLGHGWKTIRAGKLRQQPPALPTNALEVRHG